MARLQFCDYNNMVAILEKGEFNTDFHPMVDFIAASPLRYALTIKPTVFVSDIRQFWSTARIETTDEGTHILATVDVTPVLSTEEPDNSLSMGDEHLDTILATESDEVIKYSVKNLIPIPNQIENTSESNDEFSSTDDNFFSIDNIDYVEASPHDSELVSLEVEKIVIPKDEEIEDDNLREKLLRVNLLIAKIEALKGNPTPSSEFLTKSSSTSPKSFLEDTNTVDNSLPEFENFFFDLEEISSGSTTTHSDISLSEYDSFIFDLSNDQCPPTDRSNFTHEEFTDELAHIISPPEYDCFYFRNLPDPGEWISNLNFRIRKNLSSITRVNLPVEDDHSPLLAYVVWIFLAYLTYPVIPPHLHSIGNKDTIFDPCITINRFYSFKPDEASDVIISFIKKTQVNFQLQVQRVRTDNDTEFKNKTLAKLFDEVGISQQFSAARTPKQNSVVERRHRTLVEAARTMITFANLPLFLWAEAIVISCFIQYRSIIHKRFDKTPYELMNKRKPNIKFFRVFGCRSYLLNDYEDVGKLKTKGDIGVFVGYSKESASFRIYNKRTRKIHESVNSMKSSTTNVETSNVEIPSNEEEVFHKSSESFQEESSSSSLNDDVQLSLEEVGVPSSNTQSILNNMIPNVDEASTSHNVFNECLEDAYFDATLRDADWVSAMQDELDQFERLKV
nr:retrovirus-related Pol polyprotein from transposon TNT 1-94 [Tanacetum cinerariifolium]